MIIEKRREKDKEMKTVEEIRIRLLEEKVEELINTIRILKDEVYELQLETKIYD